MARRIPPIRRRPREDSRSPDEDFEAISGGGDPPEDEEEREIPTGPERLEPGTGQPRQPIEVNLTSEELRLLGDEFASEIEYQYSAQEPFRSDLSRWLEVYRARRPWEMKTYPLAHSSNLIVALAANHADQVIARLMQAIFNPQPHWVVQEINRKFAENAKPYENYLDWGRQNSWNQWEMVFDFVQDCVKLGTGIGYNDWQVQSLYRYDDQRKQTVEVGTRIGPHPRWVPREDFLLPTGFHTIQEAPWVAHRQWLSWPDLERMAHQGLIENLEDLKGHADEETEIKEAKRANKNPMVTNAGDDRFGLWAPWYVWFRRDLDLDGWPEEYVMLLHTERRKILRVVSNPSPVGTRPYFSSQFIRVAGEFDGIGIPERLEALQEEDSTIHNQRRDREHLANIVMYKRRASSPNIPESIRPESGKVITLTDINDLQEFHPSSNLAANVMEEDYVRRFAAELVGQSDIDMARLSSPAGRAAATTIMALMQEGSRRFDLNATQIRQALTEQAHQITELYQVYGLPTAEMSGSPEQVLDDKEAALVRQLLEQPVSLRGLISVRLNVATAAVNREVEKQSNVQLYGIVSGYMNQVIGQIAPMFLRPDIPPELKSLLLHGVKGLDKTLTKIFQAHNAFDLESVLVADMLEELGNKPPSPQAIQQAQQAQLQQQQEGGGPPAQEQQNPLTAIMGGKNKGRG